MSVTAVVGAQYGSEGKGAIVKAIAEDFHVHVRTGAPNAGHTIHHEGRKWVMRSVPCGWVSPNSHLVIGPGAVVDVALLMDEIRQLEAAGYEIGNRLYVDPKAAVLDPIRHHKYEGGVDGTAHEVIGSTGEGVGPCRMARLARTTFRDEAWAKLDLLGEHRLDLELLGVKFRDVSSLLATWYETGGNILLEGTQGSGLSLIHGPWPYVTSCDTNVTSLLCDAGLPPAYLKHTILVARTYPIRVAGQSGPLRDETTWQEIGVEPETTTVTKKERRVGAWDHDIIHMALRLNRPAVLALTFADYWWPEIAGCVNEAEVNTVLSQTTLKEYRSTMRSLEDRFQAAIKYIGTGPDSVIKR